ncbi:MAG: hypothetical protein OHK0012_22970 [Synechococcales cyanobacterium]
MNSSTLKPVEISMKELPKTTEASLLLRTDFSDDSAWNDLCEAVQELSEEGFHACLDCINDPTYESLTVEQVVALSAESDDYSLMLK